EVAGPAAAWLRIAALGIPGLLLATAGNGWLRGVQDTRRPPRYILGANLLSAGLCPLLVYGAGLGLPDSAVANATAQTLSGSLVGAALGAADATAARALARRIARVGLLCGAAFAVVILAGAGVLPRLFTGDPEVYRQAMRAWPWFAGMQPAAGVVFALDGVLI